MTAIVAKIHEGYVWMGADHLGSDGFVKTEFIENSKVFKNGDFLIGYTTSFRMGQILQYSWKPPYRVEGISDDQYFYKAVLDSIRNCFKDNDYGDKVGVDWQSGNFLVGWKGRLFEVENAHALEHKQIAAVGSGCYHAIGAMKALLKVKKYEDDPQAFLECALEVATGSVVSVGKQYSFIHEDLK